MVSSILLSSILGVTVMSGHSSAGTDCYYSNGRKVCSRPVYTTRPASTRRVVRRRVVRTAPPPPRRVIVERRVVSRPVVVQEPVIVEEPVVIQESRPVEVVEAPAVPRKRKPRDVVEVKHGIGLAGGMIGGQGFAYRGHMGNLGIQIGGSGSNIGAQAMVDLMETRGMSFYMLGGVGTFWRERNVWGMDQSKVNLGGGLGAELNIANRVGIALEAPAVYRFFDNDNPEIADRGRNSWGFAPSVAGFIYF